MCVSLIRILAVSFALACTACERGGQPASQPASAPALTLLAPESLTWTREQATKKLGDPQLGVSAAVRLVRLADVAALCVPEALTDNQVRRLRVMKLNEEQWALGMPEQGQARRLRAPVLIAADGLVTPLAEGVEEELIVLHVAKDPEVFPHLAILPQRVSIVAEAVETAVVLAPEQNVRFELREERGYGYVALVLDREGGAAEVARYKWSPYEASFLGPACDKLPDPPGGKFMIDLAASERLEPVGGELPETRPIQPKPPADDERPFWDRDLPPV